MPYRERDPWHQTMREYLASMKGTVSETTLQDYKWSLDAVGRIAGLPHPRRMTMEDLRRLEGAMPWCETTRAVRLIVTRQFLRWAGCHAANGWRTVSKQRPKQNGVFLSEPQVAVIRARARELGPLCELIYSLGVDNGLRSIDMRRLTMLNAKELMERGRSQILGKGRGRGKVGLLELNSKTRQPLAEYMQQRQEVIENLDIDRPELLVIEFRGRLLPLGYGTMKEIAVRLSLSAGIHFRLHDLRRTYGHRLHMVGIPIETIARLMRHESIDQSFKAYIGIDSDEMRAAQDKLAGM